MLLKGGMFPQKGAKFRAKLQVRVVQGPGKGPREVEVNTDGCLKQLSNYHERKGGMENQQRTVTNNGSAFRQRYR